MENDVETPPQEPAEQPHGLVGGLFASIAQMIATVIGIAQTRLELLTTELQEEVHRVAEIVVYSVIALLSAGAGMFLLALVVIFLFWDTHRVLAAVSVTGVFFLIAVVAGLILRAKVRAKPPMLDATIAELKKDRATLMSKRQ